MKFGELGGGLKPRGEKFGIPCLPTYDEHFLHESPD